MTPGPIYLSRDDLLRIHEALVRRYGGMPGVRDEHALESCLAQPQAFVFDVERFPALVDKAAAYCFFIVRNHPFFDGNKRTGFTGALHFLHVNGVAAQFEQDESYDIILEVAKGDSGLARLKGWIAEAVARGKA